MLKIPEQIAESIIAQGLATPEIEVCGILAGKDGAVEEIYPMTNADNSIEHFTMRPEEQFAVIKDIRRNGLQMLAIYHTHPETPARPSEEDIRLAFTGDVLYIITSLAERDAPVTKGFLIEDGRAREVELEIV